MLLRPAALVLAVLLTAVAACGEGEDRTADTRADQVKDAAIDAGLPEDVADVLALAARGATATFRVTYPGADGAEVVVQQDPPNRRVDVLTAGLVVESQVERDGVGYLCRLPEGGRPGDALDCSRRQGAITGPGAFTDQALDTFTADLAAVLDDVDLTVEARTIADVEATCLISAPKAGTVIDGTESVDTICLASTGAQLLVDVGGERVVASDYSTEVPDGTFDV